MQSHGPKRVYTPQSLEFWFGKLENDWAAAFSESQLETGRQLYRNGEVRELELTAQDAIIHRRVDKRDEYAVIEWTSEGVSVRSSSTDHELAHALAVAGLLEIEELVADEISPLPRDSLRAVPSPGAPAPFGGSASGHQPRPASSFVHRQPHGLGNGFGLGAAAASNGPKSP